MSREYTLTTSHRAGGVEEIASRAFAQRFGVRSHVSARGCRARRCCMGDRAAVSRMARLPFDPTNQAAGVPRAHALERCDSPRNAHA